MSLLHDVLSQRIPEWRRGAAEIVKEHGDTVVSQVTVRQVFGGMRGVKAIPCDTSYVDPHEGLYIRGQAIGSLTDRLPEEIFYLLCTGELPSEDALAQLQDDLHARTSIPQYVWNVVNQLPPDCHPMAMLSAALLVLERESVFKQKLQEGIAKEEQWRPALDDALNLIAKLPLVAAGIYRVRFGHGLPLHPRRGQDWGAYYASALGFDDNGGDFARFVRLHLVLHSDHEGGNVSANTCQTVASALSDPYLALSAALNGLAGPLHGVANQEALRYVLGVRDALGERPTDEQLREHVWNTLNEGRVIPGYGHAVLRQTDPRFKALHVFGKKTCPDDPVFGIVDQMYRLVPEILKEHGRAKNPYPNVDAISGSLLHYYGIKEFSYYTVLFALSRGLGVLAQLVLARALTLPITRPKSVTTEWIRKEVASNG